jgi:hypothetical protein
MPYPKVTGRYDKTDSDDLPRTISWQQLFVLHVAANYKLRRDSMGWWADRHEDDDGPLRVHSPATVKSLLKKGLLEGNARGENIALGGLDGKSTMKPPIPKLWTSAKGNKLLDEVTSDTGIMFDRKNYRLVEPGRADGIKLENFDRRRFDS